MQPVPLPDLLGGTMTRRLSTIVALLAALLLLPIPTIAPAAAVTPAAVPTTTRLLSATPSGEVGSIASYSASVDPPDVAGVLSFEASTDDGASWVSIAGGTLAPDGLWHGSNMLPPEIGTRRVRAHFLPASPDVLESWSDPVAQVISGKPSAITAFVIWDGNECQRAFVPGTTPLILTATTTAPNWDGSTDTNIIFETANGAGWDLLGQGTSLGGDWLSGWSSRLTIPSLPEGVHTLRARYPGTTAFAPSSATIQVTVARRASVVSIGAGSLEVQAHHPLILYPNVVGVSCTPPTGTLTLREGATVLGVVAAPGGEVTIASLSLGPHVLTADYEGDLNNFPGTSDPFTVIVVSDVVDATVGALTYAKFYPYKDGYRDSVTARGTRAERVAVAFAVRDSTGKVVRTGSIASGTGAYAWAWNGRRASGTRVAAGTYTIWTTLKDAAGTTKSVRQSVAVSAKRLYWYTTDLYKTSTQTQKSTSNWGAWQFAMPSGVAYKNLRLYVYGHSNITFDPSGFGSHDRRTCPFSTIDAGCTRTTYRLGFIDGWSSGAVNATYGRSGRYVRAYVWAGGDGGKVWVRRLRLHVAYALLK